MLPLAYVSHEMFGRTRIRVPGLRRHAPYFQAVERILSECESVRRVETNPLSGGILVFHRTSLEDIARFAKASNLFDLVIEPAAGPPSSRVARQIGRLDRTVTSLTLGRVDTRTWVFSGLMIAAVYQMLRGNALPAGVTLMHYALDALPRPGLDEG
jgi:hypothetical protein